MVTVGRVRTHTLVWRKVWPSSWLRLRAARSFGFGVCISGSAGHDSAWISVPTTAMAAEPAWNGGAMTGLVIATVYIPIVGLIMGPMALGKPARKSQGIALLIIGIVMFVIYVGATV